MKSNFKRVIASVSSIALAASAFASLTITASAAGYTRTLSDSFTLEGYEAGTLYNFQTNEPAVLTVYDDTTGKLAYRAGGIWGLHNFAAGTRSETAQIPVSAGDKLVLQHYSHDVVTTINCGTLNAELTASAGYEVYDIASDSDSITFTAPRYGGIVAALVMSPAGGGSEPEPVVVPTGTSATVPYSYAAENVDYGIGGVQAGDSFWKADGDLVKVSKEKAGVHYTGIANKNNLGYPVNKIIIPIPSGLDAKDTTIYVMKNAPAENAMVNKASGAYTTKTGTGVKSFIGMENQIFDHPSALDQIDNPDVLNEDNMIARVYVDDAGKQYDVTAGGANIAVTENNKKFSDEAAHTDTEGVIYGKNNVPKAFFITVKTDKTGVPYSLYDADDLFIYVAKAGTLGSFGPVKVDFEIPAESLEIQEDLTISTADYFADHTAGVYCIGRVNTNGLKNITLTGNSANTEDAIVKLFALPNKVAGKDELKDFLHDYTHQETDKNSLVYKNVKYDELGEVELTSGNSYTASTAVDDPNAAVKFIYAVVMRKTPVEAAGGADVTDTGVATPDLTKVTYNYEAPRYANAVEAEYYLLNTEVENAIVGDEYALRDDYNDYETYLNDRINRINDLKNAGKTENVFTETYAAKWAKILDEQEAMSGVVYDIWNLITSAGITDDSFSFTKDDSTKTARENVEKTLMKYNKLSKLGKSYVAENNYDELEKAYNKLKSFYEGVIAEYLDNVAAVYDTANGNVLMTKDNYLGENGTGWNLKALSDLVDYPDYNAGSQYNYDKGLSKNIAEAIDPEKGGVDVVGIVNDLNNVKDTFIPATRDKFDQLYEAFISEYENAKDKTDTSAEGYEAQRKVIDKQTELSKLVSDINNSPYKDEIKAAIGTDGRYSWKNKVDNFTDFENVSAFVEKAKKFVEATNAAKETIAKDNVQGISRNSYKNIEADYWTAADAREAYQLQYNVMGDPDYSDKVLKDFGLYDAVKDAEQELDYSYKYMERAAEIITADVRAALDDIASGTKADGIAERIAVVATNNSAISKYFSKAKYVIGLYDDLVKANPSIVRFLSTGDYSNDVIPYEEDGNAVNDYYPYAQGSDDNGGYLHDGVPVNYTAIRNAAKALMDSYYNEAKSKLEQVYAANKDTLEDYIATFSFRDLAFDNFNSKYNDMAAVDKELERFNNIYKYYASDLDFTDKAKETNKVDDKDKEEDITTEVLRKDQVTVGLKSSSAKHTDYNAFHNRLAKYKSFRDTITNTNGTGLHDVDLKLRDAIQDLIDKVAPDHTLSEFAIGQDGTRELVEQVEDYIINTLPDPTKDVEDLLSKVDTAIENHEKAVVAYNNAYVSIGGHAVTDYTTGNNLGDDPNATQKTHPDYYFDVDPMKYTADAAYYFSKRDVDAWDLRLRPAIETGLDARAGYDAASIADSMKMIPDGTITAENFHDWDDTLIPAHELYERARKATQDKIQKDYADAYNHYLDKWNEYVAVNDEVAAEIAKKEAAAEAKANEIINAINALYAKVIDPATVYTTTDQVDTDSAEADRIQQEIEDAIADADGNYTYLNRNYFKSPKSDNGFVVEDHEPKMWTIESILDDWYKCIPIIDRANYDNENLNIVDDLDETNVKVGYKVVVGDEDAHDEFDELWGEFNTVRTQGGTIFSGTPINMMDDAVNTAFDKYVEYRDAVEHFGTPAYNIPKNINYYNVSLYKPEIERLYNYYRNDYDRYSDTLNENDEPVSSEMWEAIHRVIETFFMDEVEKINGLYDILDVVRPVDGKTDYDAAMEFNAELQDYLDNTSSLSAQEFYDKYLELLKNHPKSLSLVDPVRKAAYDAIVGGLDAANLIQFTNAVKAFDYGSYANPWGADNLVMAGQTPDEVASEAKYQTQYDAAMALYDALSSNAKDAVADPSKDYEKEAAIAYDLLVNKIPVWHKDFVAGYKDAAVASAYAGIANNWKDNITEATYKDALAAYEDAVDAKATLDKYPKHNIFESEKITFLTDVVLSNGVTYPAGTEYVINPNFDLADAVILAAYADAWTSEINDGVTATIKSAVAEQLDKTNAVMKVEDLINEIGTVTIEKGDIIAAARMAYEAMSPAYQGAVKNYQVLVDAEKAYSALDDVVNAKKYAGTAINAIDAIGTVTRQSGDAIKSARAKYDALSDLSKSFVSNYNTLTKAEEDYARLEKASGDVTGDGQIGLGDVNMVLQAILGTVNLTDAQKVAADVNQDGKINVLDLVEMISLW